MENSIELLDKDILSISEGRIEKRKRMPLIGVVSFLIGALVIALCATNVIAVDGLQIFLFSVALIALVYGLIKICVREEYYFDTKTNSELKKDELFFDIVEFEKLKSYYSDKKYSKILELKQSPQAGALLTIYGTKEGTLFYSQISKYVPYRYVPYAKSIEHSAEENQEIQNLIANYNKK